MLAEEPDKQPVENGCESVSDESYSGCSEMDDDSVTDLLSQLSLEEVPDPFRDYTFDSKKSEDPDEEMRILFELSQTRLRAWDAAPDNGNLKEGYFQAVHDLVICSSFSKMQKNPYDLDWKSASLAEARLSFNVRRQIFYVTHYQLSKLVHNSVPHILQVLCITPSKTRMWYDLAQISVSLGDWKHAEFAYRKYMLFGGDKTKAMQNILLLFYVSGDFLRTIVFLGEFMKYQPKNAVAHIVILELRKLKGPWAAHLEDDLKHIEKMKLPGSLSQQKIDSIVKKIEQFRSRFKPRCQECVIERQLSGQSTVYFELEPRDALFGRRVLQLYKDFLLNPNRQIVVCFPAHENESRPSPSKKFGMSTSNSTTAEATKAITNEQGKSQPFPKERPKVPFTVSGSKYTYYTQIVDFLNRIADFDRTIEIHQELYGLNGITWILDQLLSHMINHFDTTKFMRMRQDSSVFRNLYQQWHKLTDYGRTFNSENLAEIHHFAAIIGTKNARKRVDLIVQKMLAPTQSSVESRGAYVDFNSNVDDAQSELFPTCKVQERMLLLCEKLEKKRELISHEAMEVSIEEKEPTGPPDKSPLKTPRLIVLFARYLSGFKRLPEYIDQMKFSEEVFSTEKAPFFTAKQRRFLIAFHLEKVRSIKASTEKRTLGTVNVALLLEYKHLFSMLEIADSHLAGNAAFQTAQTGKELGNDPEILQLLSEIGLTVPRVNELVDRAVQIPKCFKHYDN